MTEDSNQYLGLYQRWQSLKPGPRAEIRRAPDPDSLMDLPAFYRLVAPLGWQAELPITEKGRWKRLVFLVEHVTDKGEDSLGKALARSGKVNEKRLMQVVHSDYPNDVIQLRRLLKHVEPAVSWPKMATQIWHWGKYQKRALMEDFILNQKETKD